MFPAAEGIVHYRASTMRAWINRYPCSRKHVTQQRAIITHYCYLPKFFLYIYIYKLLFFFCKWKIILGSSVLPRMQLYVKHVKKTPF